MNKLLVTLALSSMAIGAPQPPASPTPTPPAEEAMSLSVAANSLNGSYEQTLGELVSACDGQVKITQAQGITGGSTGNLEALANNKAQAALVRTDVFTAISQADVSYKRFKTLVALYPEPLHILVLRDSKTKKKGFLGDMGLGGKASFNSLAEIKDYPVGAGGGTIYTLKILKGQGGGSFQIAQYDNGTKLIQALVNGDIAAAAFIGAPQLPILTELMRKEENKNKFKLIPLGDSIVNNVKGMGIYKSVTINYPGLSEGPVFTLASTLVVLTRKFSTKQKLDAQRNFRQCFQKNLAQLQDNGSPGWQLIIDPNDKGSIDWYDIP